MNRELQYAKILSGLFLAISVAAGEMAEKTYPQVVVLQCKPQLRKEIKGISKQHNGKYEPVEDIWLVLLNGGQEVRLLWATQDKPSPIDLKMDQNYTCEIGMTINKGMFVHYIRRMTIGLDIVLEDWFPVMSEMVMRK